MCWSRNIPVHVPFYLLACKQWPLVYQYGSAAHKFTRCVAGDSATRSLGSQYVG